MRIVYADNNATTPVAPEVVEAMGPFFTESYFNPSSMYEPARKVQQALQRARATVARHLGLAEAKPIIFTGCATESNNAAIMGAAKANPARRHIITTAVEHPAVLEVCKDLQRDGCRVTWLDVDGDGNLDMGQYIRALAADTLLVSIMHANNETGVVFPIEELARLAKETDPQIVFHCDATQSVGKLPIDLSGRYRHVDLLSFSGHKLHAPKGIGVLYIRPGTRCRPLLIGGHQEEGRRAGTENVPYIIGLARAIELAEEGLADEQTRVRGLRDKLERSIEALIPNVQVNGKGAPRLPNTLNVACHFVEGEGMLYQLSDAGICASSGSACTSGSLEPSHVLRAMQVPFTAVHGSIRFSLSRYNTEADIDYILQVFPGMVANLRRLSPYWDQEQNAPCADADELIARTRGVDVHFSFASRADRDGVLYQGDLERAGQHAKCDFLAAAKHHEVPGLRSRFSDLQYERPAAGNGVARIPQDDVAHAHAFGRGLATGKDLIHPHAARADPLPPPACSSPTRQRRLRRPAVCLGNRSISDREICRSHRIPPRRDDIQGWGREWVRPSRRSRKGLWRFPAHRRWSSLRRCRRCQGKACR